MSRFPNVSCESCLAASTCLKQRTCSPGVPAHLCNGSGRNQRRANPRPQSREGICEWGGHFHFRPSCGLVVDQKFFGPGQKPLFSSLLGLRSGAILPCHRLPPDFRRPSPWGVVDEFSISMWQCACPITWQDIQWIRDTGLFWGPSFKQN